MTVVEKKVRAARWRLEWINFSRRFVRLVSVALVLLAVCVVADKLLGPPWSVVTIAWWIGGAIIPLALLWAVATRTSVRDAAIAVDQKMGLRERLSTALVVGPPRTAMETALAADAESHARPLRPHRVFPMPFWRDFYFLPVPVLIMALVGVFLPRLDLLRAKKDPGETQLSTEAQRRLAQRLNAVQRELDKVTKTVPPVELREVSNEMENLLRDLKAQDRRLTQADVLKNLSRMTDRVAERRNELEKELEATKTVEKFRPSADMTKKLAESVAKGNFAQAKAEMAKLQTQLDKKTMSSEQQKNLAEELKGLAEALKGNSELSKALANTAKNLKAGDLKEALADLQLTEQQLQDLADALRQMAELDKLGRDLKGLEMGQGLPCGGCGKPGCAACAAYAALMAEMGLFRPGDTDRPGPGMGGPGRGEGGRAQFKETATNLKATQTRMKIDKGDIIAAIRVWGPQVKGEMKAGFEEAYVEYRQTAEDTLNREHVPLELRTIVRDYFDAIRPATTASTPEPETTDGAPAGGTEP